MAWLWGSVSALALTRTVNFTSYSERGSTDMVWNLSTGSLHPRVLVNWNDGSPETTIFDLGDGRHGSFNVNTYSTFSENGDLSGQVIRINTDTYQELQFTDFTLNAGWTIRPTGSRALVIKVHGTVVVAGTIDCSGEDGANVNANNAMAAPGGRAVCGGGDGGDGGVAGVGPTTTNNGRAGGPSVGGGTAGALGTATAGIGGGGGGGYLDFADHSDGSYPNPDAGEDPDAGGADDGGTPGAVQTDDGFALDPLGAGSGGGGGSAFNGPGNTARFSSGAGGGAGGGAIHIFARGDITVTSTGRITADGGDGGGCTGACTYWGGAGGGGAGGSIFMMSAGSIILNSTPSVTALRGVGGTSNVLANGGNGGHGRTWLVDDDVFAGGTGATEDPATFMAAPGATIYQTGQAYTAISNAIDLLNTRPTLTAANLTTVNSGSASAGPDLEVAFSSSSDPATFGVWQSPSTLVSAGDQLSRYVRFRVTMTNNSTTAPVEVTALNLEYDGFVQTDFEFESACGGVSAGSTGGFWFLLTLPLLILGLIRWTAQSPL